MLNKNRIGSLGCIAVIVLFTVNSHTVAASVKNSLLLCYNSVIGALFPFMVISSYMATNNYTAFISLPFRKFAQLIKIDDKAYPAFLSLSLIGGFSVGAMMLKKLEEKGYSENCLFTVAPSFINNSFSFCIFVAGAIFLGNINTGILLYISLCTASLITTFILSFIYRYNIVSPAEIRAEKGMSITEAVNQSVINILCICGFIVLCNVLCEVISLYIAGPTCRTALFSVTEITSGCAEIIGNQGKNAYLICAVLSFYPVCTLCQVFHFTKSAKLILNLILSRIIHTPVSLCIFSVLCNLFPVASDVIKPDSIVVKTVSNTAETSAVLYMIALCFVMISESNKIFTKHRK